MHNKLLNKARRLKSRESKYFVRMKETLDQLREQRDLLEDDIDIQYKEYIQSEINHIEKIFGYSNEKTNNSKLH